MAESPKEFFKRISEHTWKSRLHMALMENPQDWAGDPHDWQGQFIAALRVVGLPREGYEGRRQRCIRCGTRPVYDSDYDALSCPTCNIWLEAKCDNPECVFCAERPEKPSTSQQ
jgi:hypothetical protein